MALLACVISAQSLVLLQSFLGTIKTGDTHSLKSCLGSITPA